MNLLINAIFHAESKEINYFCVLFLMEKNLSSFHYLKLALSLRVLLFNENCFYAV